MPPFFADQFAAKAFFVDRVVAQAIEEGSPLSKAESYQLNWTEVEPGFEMDPELDAKFEQETDAQTYEEKIRGLVERAYLADVAVDEAAREGYRAAHEVLGKHDYYVLIMIDAAIGPHLRKRRWRFW